MSKLTGIHLMFITQFLLFIVGMFVDIKIGLIFTACVLIFTIVTLIQLSDDENTDWKTGRNIMLGLFAVWFVYYLLELFNPNNVIQAWNINLPPYALFPLIFAFLVPITIRNTKSIEYLLFIWSVFVIIFTLKGYWQKNHGFSDRDLFFLYSREGWRTHLIWSGIRYFSCFSDAANYGVHAAMSSVVFSISAFFVKQKWKQIYFLFIAACALYGMGISGTRSAMGVIAGGIITIAILAQNWKAVFTGSVLIASIFCFFYFTVIGSGNQYIWKMRSAFHPDKDASYLVRIENRAKMKTLMAEKPIGYGIGLSKAGNFESKERMPYPPDSWLISVWVETGIIGLIIYLLIHGILFTWCAWILLFRIRDKRLRGLVAAWFSMDVGFFIAAYVNDVMQYPNQLPVYVGFALCFAAQHIDERIWLEKEQIPKNIINEIV